MATARLRISNPPGTTVFDSTQAGVGCLALVIGVPGSTTTVRTFPAWPGRTCVAVPLSLSAFMFPFGTIGISIDYALGYPRVTWSSGDYGQTYTYAVFLL